MEFKIKQIAEFLNGVIEGDDTQIINNLGKIEIAKKGELTFLANPKYTPFIYTTKATAVVVNKDFKPEKPINSVLIRVDDAYSSFARLLEMFTKEKPPKGISRKAKIHKSAKIGKNVYIAEFVSIAENVEIGDNTVIHPNVTIYKNVKIKNDCLIYANAIIMHNCEVGNNCIIQPGAVVGPDGFGFAPTSDGTYFKIPQTGNVVLEDNVEIGTNATIDRATMGSTFIRKGAKIDNLIQIGHNCDIGRNTVVAGQSGISGLTKIGENCMIGGQTGIIGHLKIGNNVMIAAKSGVMADVKDGAFLMGYPAIDNRNYKKSSVYFRKLDELAKTIRNLEKQIEELKTAAKE